MNLAQINSCLTKAEMLTKLYGQLENAQVLPVKYFTVSNWLKNRQDILNEIQKEKEFNVPLIVRSSSLNEDGFLYSNAGTYDSILHVQGTEHLIKAIDQVVKSYQSSNESNQVLVQPMLSQVKVSGVIFTKDPNTGSDYYIINYDDISSQTDSITAGKTNDLKCYVHHKLADMELQGDLGRVIQLARELESKLNNSCLDIEFAISEEGKLYLFQARPLILQEKSFVSPSIQLSALERIRKKIAALTIKHPYLYGDQGIFGVMPDWNPAEIIGVKPKPLAFSLYRELVTNATWAYQRDNYGYCNLRSFPLIVDFEGVPYVDVRVSFNSFIPKTLSSHTAHRLVNYYLNRLRNNPSLHDKVEFQIVFSCYTFSLKKKLASLTNHDFSAEDIIEIYSSLRNLTQNIVLNERSLWKKDLEKIEVLKERQETVLYDQNLDLISKMYWLIEDCKRYGVLPFAGLARLGFIAVEILKSFVENQILTHEEYDQFFLSLKTISSQIDHDFVALEKNEFLKIYGHLRPGTYEIASPSYEENPDLYFNWDQKQTESITHQPFQLSMLQLRKIQDQLTQDGWNITVLDFLEFIKTAIESREYSKFVFTKSIHYFHKLLSEYAANLGFSKEDCSYISCQDILQLYSESSNEKEFLQKCIENRKAKYQITKSLNLPPLLHPNSLAPFSFLQPVLEPNYITQNCAEGLVAFPQKDQNLEGKMVFIPSADPGYDWIFLKKIKGFITQYGGINSHMAIRSNELGIPAIIGAGEVLFNKWAQAKKLHIDCLNKKVTILQ